MKVPDFNPETIINGRLVKKLERLGLRNDSIYPIPKGMERVWQVFIDGQKVDHYSHLAAKSQYGLMNIGLSLDKGQYVTLQEADSSGAVIIPFVIIQNEKLVYLNKLNKKNNYLVYAGLIRQWRLRQGGWVWNVPRGYANLGENSKKTAARELMEETGLAGKLFLLPGQPLNPNSTYFETGHNGGVIIYAINLGPDLADWQNNKVTLRHRPRPTGIDETIKACRFFPLARLSQLGDMFSVAAESRLRYYLENLR